MGAFVTVDTIGFEEKLFIFVYFLSIPSRFFLGGNEVDGVEMEKMIGATVDNDARKNDVPIRLSH